jgi:aminopeptidase C
MPETFEYENKTYTPQSFAQSLGVDADDYVSLTSFTHHPFHTQFAIEVQDNWRWGLSYNLTLDELMETMDYAIQNGYTIAWGADVSEKYFNRNSTSIASVPADAKNTSTEGSDQERWIGKSADKKDAFNSSDEKIITQELRQEGFDNWETTDDHGMLLYGIAKDQNGKEYFMVKNSWNTTAGNNGIWYASDAYVAYKTMNILVHKDALPKDIKKKLGIK